LVVWQNEFWLSGDCGGAATPWCLDSMCTNGWLLFSMITEQSEVVGVLATDLVDEPMGVCTVNGTADAVGNMLATSLYAKSLNVDVSDDEN
jgi:hypothetical protein